MLWPMLYDSDACIASPSRVSRANTMPTVVEVCAAFLVMAEKESGHHTHALPEHEGGCDRQGGGHKM